MKISRNIQVFGRKETSVADHYVIERGKQLLAAVEGPCVSKWGEFHPSLTQAGAILCWEPAVPLMSIASTYESQGQLTAKTRTRVQYTHAYSTFLGNGFYSRAFTIHCALTEDLGSSPLKPCNRG